MPVLTPPLPLFSRECAVRARLTRSQLTLDPTAQPKRRSRQPQPWVKILCRRQRASGFHFATEFLQCQTELEVRWRIPWHVAGGQTKLIDRSFEIPSSQLVQSALGCEGGCLKRLLAFTLRFRDLEFLLRGFGFPLLT